MQIKLGSKWKLKQVIKNNLDSFPGIKENKWPDEGYILEVVYNGSKMIHYMESLIEMRGALNTRPLFTEEELTTYYEQVEEPRTCMIKGYKCGDEIYAVWHVDTRHLIGVISL